jgi:hypothetical protein
LPLRGARTLELRDDGLAAATINLIHVVIHRSLRDARAMRLIGSNPAQDIAKPAARDRDATDHAFTAEQLVVLDRVVQELMGHARIEMTMDLYTGSVPSVLAEAVGRLDRGAV